MITSAFSQNTYPKRIIWENDTLLAITRSQLVTINRTINNYTHLKSINKALQVDLCFSDSLCNYWKHIAESKGQLVQMENTKYNESLRAMRNLEESCKVQKRKSRKAIVGVGIGGAIIGVIIAALLIK